MRSVSRRNSFRPRLESLEDRRLLACDVFLRDGTLFIVGDGTNNNVAFLAEDHRVQVTCDGKTQTFDPSDVLQLDVQTGDGSDTIGVRFDSAAGQLAQKVRIDSGAGNDHVAVNMPAVQHDGLADLIVGADAGAGPHVKAFDGGNDAEVKSFFAYGPGFSGGVRVAAGDVNNDGVADIITGAGPTGGPHVKVFDGRSGAVIRSFFAYGPTFAGGIYVAAGDVNGDGFSDIITGAGAGAPGGHVKVFDGRSGALLRSFFAYGTGFTGDVRVAAGDVNGDGRADIITGAGLGAPGGHVKAFSGHDGSLLYSFFAYTPGFSGGVFVAAGDVNGDGRADIITGTDAGAPGGHVKVFDGASLAELRSFLAYDPSFSGGVRVAAGDVNGDGFAEIITGAGPGAGPHVKVFDGQTNAELKSFFAFDPSFTGGLFVAAGDLNSSVRPQLLSLDLDIATQQGNDAVNVNLNFFADEVQQKVRIDTGIGNDSARFLIADNLPPAPRNRVSFDLDYFAGAGRDSLAVQILPYIEQDNFYRLRFDLGAGNDVARYWVFGTELPRAAGSEQLAGVPGRFDFEVLGGQGNDDIQGRIGNPLGAAIPLALGQALIDIDGGSGNDRLSLNFRDTIFNDESVEAVLHGGDGNDQVRARFDLGSASTGKLSAQVFGDADNDDLGLAVLGSEQLDDFFALLDGGIGRDRCRATKNVVVKNCEL